MWGWSSWEASLISRRNRSAATLTSSSGCRILSATCRPPGSLARKILALPPLPISRSTSYCPSNAWRTRVSMSRRMLESLCGTSNGYNNAARAQVATDQWAGRWRAVGSGVGLQQDVGANATPDGPPEGAPQVRLPERDAGLAGHAGPPASGAQPGPGLEAAGGIACRRRNAEDAGRRMDSGVGVGHEAHRLARPDQGGPGPGERDAELRRVGLAELQEPLAGRDPPALQLLRPGRHDHPTA